MADPAAGAMAAAFVRSGDSVAVGPGTRSVVSALISRRDLSNVTVHTESLSLTALFRGQEDRFTVIVPPGLLSPSMTVIPERDHHISVELALIGCSGITADGVQARTELAASAGRRATLSGCRVVAVVMPGSAAPSSESHLISSLDLVDACITSERLPDELVGSLRANGLRLFITS
ncbi:hypothetical protein ACIRG5_47280 [Lentzea sp. NPDC102401]|uniref:hypothetical protein n=1 Tax=Lentzea sp. NPDC102401 TaxID=3364128 RepID=UPI003811C0E5